MERLFKVLDENGKPFHGGSGRWSLPTDDAPGDWMPPIDNIELCKRGYHLCREGDLVGWLGPTIYEAEACEEPTIAIYDDDGNIASVIACPSRIDDNDKIVVVQGRLIRRLDTWNECTARLFACDCAERALHIFEARYPDDKRPRNAIAVARCFANGEITADEWAAARAAAWDAAWDAEREWQATRLIEYLYPEEAARDAAWAAEAAAGAAAWDAAWDVARAVVWDAAWDAAWDAERMWQTARLMEYLYG